MTVEDIVAAKQTHGQELNSDYFIREMSLDQDLSSVLESWKQCNLRFYDHTIHCDPDWLREQFKNERANVHVYCCEKDGTIVGAVPFLYGKQPLLCQLGDLTVAKFPLRVLKLQGYTPNIPPEESAHDALFGAILSFQFDAIFMNYVKADSFLWNYLHNSPLIRKSFRFYSKRGLEPHLLIHLNGTFESYMQRFSAKTRNTFIRKIKRLRNRGDTQIIRVTEESQVDSYLAAASEISRKTWQFKRLGWGIGASDPDVVRSKLTFLARRGWLRAYLLKCSDQACSFITGWQYGSRFYHAGLGFDPAWNSYSVGTVLQLLVLEDLFKENTPELYDFGTSAEYKKRFSTESYPEAIVWLFRRRPYPVLAGGVHRVFNATSRNAGVLLNRLGLKVKIKHFLREMPE
jgi:GNAT acetyltransferase-like protein